MIRGESVYLTAMDPANAETVRAWLNDRESTPWLLSSRAPMTSAQELGFYEDSEAQRRAGTAYRFEIHAADDGRLLGHCGIEHVSAIDRHGEVGIFIGPPDERDKGFGADAIVTLLRFGFDTLGLHAIRITVFPGNERAYALYRKLGFTETGRDREAWFIRGAFHDMVRLDMLEDEFRTRYGTA